MKFESYPLKDLVTIKYGKNQKKVISEAGSIPIYGTGGLMGYATEALYDKPSVLIGRKGTIKKIRYVDHPFWTVDTLFYTIVNETLVIPQFLYYCLLQIDLLQYNEGTTIPSLRTETLNRIELKIPSIDNQHRILEYLASLDNKIEINNRINQNLEQQAQAIFKSWFVDFEPFGGGMPDDWKIGKVIDIPMTITDYVANGSFASLKANVTLKKEKNFAYFIRNTDLKSDSFNTYVDKHSYEFLSKSALYGGEIIISNVGDVGSVFLCPKLDMPMTLGNNVIMLRPNNEIYQYYLYIWFKWMQGQTYIQKIKGGSAQPKFNKTDFKNTPILIPSLSILKEFCNISKSIFEKITDNNAENNQLSTIRDTLLPKLMNGEIDISEVKI